MPSNLQAGSQHHKNDSCTVDELFPEVVDERLVRLVSCLL